MALAACSIAIPVVASTVLLYGSNRGWGVQSLREAVQAQVRSRAEDEGCDSILRRSGCLFHGTQPGTVVLIGDSHASAISDMVWGLAADHDYSFGVWTRPGCAFLVGTTTSSECAAWSQEVLEWLLAVKPDVVLIHVDSTGYVKPGRLIDAAGRRAATSEEAVRYYIAGLNDITSSLAVVGTTTVILEATPTFPDSTVSRATLLRRDPRPSTRTFAEVEAETAGLDLGLSALNGQSHVVVLRAVDFICTESTCSQWRNGWIYRDSDHLSPRGAQLLRPAIEPAIVNIMSTGQ